MPLPVFLMVMDHRRTLWTLYSINFLNAIGFWFFLPLLPIFIHRRGGSPALVGLVFAASFLANAVSRYPAGWAADRFGTRPVMLGAVLATAALFLTYLLPLPVAASSPSACCRAPPRARTGLRPTGSWPRSAFRRSEGAHSASCSPPTW